MQERVDLIGKVVRMLGLEYGEKFYLVTTTGERFNMAVYFFRKDGLMRYTNSQGKTNSQNNQELGCLITGELKVAKFPYEPLDGDRYFYPAVSYKSVESKEWRGTTKDYALKSLGMIYKEAYGRFAIDYKKLTGRELGSK